MTAMRQLDVLGDRESLPVLRRHLDNPLVTEQGTWSIEGRERRYSLHSIQVAAGEALVSLLGARAAPLIERKLVGEAPREKERWIWLLSKTGQARTNPALERLSHSRDPEIRVAAVVARLEGDDDTGTPEACSPEEGERISATN
jgi:hypothetical protein